MSEPAGPPYGSMGVIAAINRLQSTVQNTGIATAPISVTPTTQAIGPSASGNIPAGSVGWAFIIQSGTGSLGGAALVAGNGVSDANKLKTNLAWTTDANSTAFLYYGTP
jgi:hypothetical protein